MNTAASSGNISVKEMVKNSFKDVDLSIEDIFLFKNNLVDALKSKTLDKK
jgi:hypothetical protein